MVLLNGKFVNDSEIDPGKHKFIGMFRYPSPPNPKGANLSCPCGQILKYVGQEREHWQYGHFDIPQYVDISEKEKG